ncbi:hypothetical protein JHK86_051027 [Glycine max]|nr:hypothetical protein JHK86_051027 [Glycine max]
MRVGPEFVAVGVLHGKIYVLSGCVADTWSSTPSLAIGRELAVRQRSVRNGCTPAPSSGSGSTRWQIAVASSELVEKVVLLAAPIPIMDENWEATRRNESKSLKKSLKVDEEGPIAGVLKYG